MNYNQYFENFETLYDDAVAKIIDLREQAQEIKDAMEAIIDSCETIENEF